MAGVEVYVGKVGGCVLGGLGFIQCRSEGIVGMGVNALLEWR